MGDGFRFSYDVDRLSLLPLLSLLLMMMAMYLIIEMRVNSLIFE